MEEVCFAFRLTNRFIYKLVQSFCFILLLLLGFYPCIDFLIFQVQ